MTSKLQNALNEQITAELWSANLYLSMSFYMKKEGYDGFAHWLKKQSEEENEHACTIADYMTKRDATPKVDKMPCIETHRRLGKSRFGRKRQRHTGFLVELRPRTSRRGSYGQINRRQNKKSRRCGNLLPRCSVGRKEINLIGYGQ